MFRFLALALTVETRVETRVFATIMDRLRNSSFPPEKERIFYPVTKSALIYLPAN